MYLQAGFGSDELSRYFPRAKSIIRTGGMDLGYIVTYTDVYLKIYDAYEGGGSEYMIYAYPYSVQHPFMVRRVKLRDLREFASNFERMYQDYKSYTG